MNCRISSRCRSRTVLMPAPSVQKFPNFARQLHNQILTNSNVFPGLAGNFPPCQPRCHRDQETLQFQQLSLATNTREMETAGDHIEKRNKCRARFSLASLDVRCEVWACRWPCLLTHHCRSSVQHPQAAVAIDSSSLGIVVDERKPCLP